jgi:hypothetical protein
LADLTLPAVLAETATVAPPVELRIETATPEPVPEPLIVTVTDQREYPAVTYDVWSAIVEAFPPEEWECAAIIAWRESRYQPDAVGALGERGSFQVRPEYHGPVPPDLHGQAQQAAGIVAAHGWKPWTTRGGC